MIILEGVDKSGKTTLFSKLTVKHNLIPYKFGVPQDDPTFGYSEVLEAETSPCIFDRFFYGELPYSIVKKRPRYMDSLAFRILQLQLESFPHRVIYLRPKREVISKRYEELGDNYVSWADINTLYDEYDMMFEQVFNKVVTYDPDIHAPDSLDPHIDQALDSREWDRVRDWRNVGQWPGIGTLRPRYLFVGERLNANAAHQVTFWSTSGKYLFDCLDQAHIDMRHCHFTNAIDGNRMIDKGLICFLNPRVVVALGDAAWSHIQKMSLPTRMKLAKLPHPAYSRRFGDIVEYIKSLEVACM